MKQVFVFLCLLLIPWISYADTGNEMWRWYFSAFIAPDQSAEINVRTGVASVNRAGNKIEISFKDKDVPELAPVLVGHVSGKKMQGTLKGFLMEEENLVLFGDLRSSWVTNKCHFDEIVLRTQIPDGSILVLNRVSENCLKSIHEQSQ